MEEKRLRLGEILVDAGVLGEQQLNRVLAIQKKRGLRLGQILLQEGFISEPQLMQALSRRLSIPWVSLEHVDIADELLDLVPARLAEEFFLIPVYIQTLDRNNRTLFVAMNDPTDEAALRFVSASAGMAVKPMVAGPSDISAAIQYFYYGEEEEDTGSYATPVIHNANTSKEAMVESSPPMELNDDAIEVIHGKPASEEPMSFVELSENVIALVDRDSREPDQAVSLVPETPTEAAERHSQVQREVEKHMFGVGAKHRGMSLTLLDGTKIDFGSASRSSRRSIIPGENEREVLINALKAAAKGEPLSSVLPAERWEAYIAALLQVLFKKNLLFYDEFVKAMEDQK